MAEKRKKFKFRINALHKLREAINKHEKALLQGGRDDLNKSEQKLIRQKFELCWVKLILHWITLYHGQAQGKGSCNKIKKQ
jgi:hypothetical protein